MVGNLLGMGVAGKRTIWREAGIGGGLIGCSFAALVVFVPCARGSRLLLQGCRHSQ